MLLWRATQVISQRFAEQGAVHKFHVCGGSQLLHTWMLQLCSAANCQELQKMLKKKSRLPTGIQDLVRYFCFLIFHAQ